MIKIRLISDSLEEIEKAVEYFSRDFPTLRFTKPKPGTNPKYKDTPQYLSYGQPRQKNGKPRNPNFTSRINHLKK